MTITHPAGTFFYPQIANSSADCADSRRFWWRVLLLRGNFRRCREGFFYPQIAQTYADFGGGFCCCAAISAAAVKAFFIRRLRRLTPILVAGFAAARQPASGQGAICQAGRGWGYTSWRLRVSPHIVDS